MNAEAQVYDVSRVVQLEEQGQITLPIEWQRELALNVGDNLTLIKLNGYFLLAPRRLVVPEMADAIARLVIEEGLTSGDLLAGLREERELLYKEQYANVAP